MPLPHLPYHAVFGSNARVLADNAISAGPLRARCKRRDTEAKQAREKEEEDELASQKEILEVEDKRAREVEEQEMAEAARTREEHLAREEREKKVRQEAAREMARLARENEEEDAIIRWGKETTEGNLFSLLILRPCIINRAGNNSSTSFPDASQDDRQRL